MKIGTAELIKNSDKYCIEKLGIPSIILMENAGLKLVENLDLDKYNSFVIVSGRGNNGGDALVAARHLYCMGKHVEIFLLGLNPMSKDCEKNYSILKNFGLRVNTISNVEDIEYLRDAINRSDVTIDGIFGTGLSRNVEGIYDLAITIINENSKNIVSIDIPSGFHCNSGRVLGNCIKADKTVTFEVYKKGFINYDIDKLTGEIILEKIGIPGFVIDKFHDNEFMLDEKMIKNTLKRRDKYSYKGNYGNIVIIAGSKGFTGAAVISTRAAVRCGAGLVTLCTYEDIMSITASKLLEAMTCSLDDNKRFDKLLDKADVIAIGPGLGNNKNTLDIIKKILKLEKATLVIDADGINVLENNLELLKGYRGEIILTPHLGEMSRICGLPIEEIRRNRLEISKKFAKDNGVVLLLKGYNTIITDGNMTYINPTGNSAMANGGMGDCLTGMISALAGQGYTTMESAYLGAYLHGKCGDEIAQDMFCVNAEHIIENLPYTMKNFV